MSSKIITNPKTSVIPGMNHNMPSGCGYYRSMLESSNYEQLMYVVKNGSRSARRVAQKKLNKYLIQQKKSGVFYE